jgi:hypothetical protein
LPFMSFQLPSMRSRFMAIPSLCNDFVSAMPMEEG